MLLPDHQIAADINNGRIRIAPYRPQNLQPASIDLTLSNQFYYWPQTPLPPLDVCRAEPDGIDAECNRFEVAPGEFLLACTQELIELPDNIAARIEGKSSLGRLALMVHSTAGYVDPGFCGQLTLEIVNLSKRVIILTAGMPIAQLSFLQMSRPAAHPYGSRQAGSHYQGQTGPTPSAGVRLPARPSG